MSCGQAVIQSIKVSIVIPCFNHGEFVQEAVESVTRAGRDDLELIVVDDGSTDERTRKEMDAISARGTKVLRQENKGLAAARNAGVLASQGEYIFPLDADDRLRSGWLEKGVGILHSDSKIGIVYGDAQCFGSRTNRWTVGPFETARLLRWNYIHASALCRRAVWEQNRGYDGTMPVQGLEDWDFWLGALEHGWQFAYLPEVFFDYRQTEGSMISKTYAFENQIREFVGRKHGVLYQQAWQSLDWERKSVRATSHNLGRLLKSRLKQRFQKNKSDGHANR
jgi:glycosyltransferase involved in cell wall biosynthesis